VRIKHSSAIVKGIADGTIEWERDPDFGYFVAASVPGIDDDEVLQPRKLYERTGRKDEYDAHVARLKSERGDFLSAFSSLSDEIITAVR
jgi:phosphoenolpyruvate carboxykinase (ATP)